MECFDRIVSTTWGVKLLFWGSHQNISVRRSATGLRYIVIGDESKPALMLVHGAFAGMVTWIRFVRFKRLYAEYCLIIPERPGYGASFPREVILSIEKQADLLLNILKEENKTATVLGHSYGGPIVMMMGKKAPQLIHKIIGISGQYNPKDEITYAISPLIKKSFFRYLLPRMMWAANEEKTGHIEALKKIEPLYHEITVPVVLIHGEEDVLVHLNNSYYLKERLAQTEALFVLKGRDHPLPIEAPKALVEVVLERLQ